MNESGTGARKHVLSNEERQILEELLAASSVAAGGTDRKKFRAKQYAAIQAIESLEQRRLIHEQGERYFVGVRALVELSTPASQKLLKDAEVLFKALQEKYLECPGGTVAMQSASDATGLPMEDVIEAMNVMIEAPSWCQGRSTAIVDSGSYVMPAEKILGFKSFTETIELLRTWDQTPMGQTFLAPFPQGVMSESQRSVLFAVASHEEDGPSSVTRLMGEVQKAMQTELPTLAMMGLRAAIDMIATELIGDGGNFTEKLEKLRGKYLSDQQFHAVKAAVEAGHASAHRGHVPGADELRLVLGVVQHLIVSAFALPRYAEKINAKTPPRRSK